ncbi:tetratricopeptide repeat protein [Tolypothrix sp. FACHB-123]|uniref:CHAT domain-containing protein n=1 Tax=Tolypothrix sp. FACHB-123 TaxID=2692868 RepID=UPI001683D0DA|nr:CHAT domain-containing protein [Tolypothrix sp. FACHB-123]MBD2358130.1 tetratricopeptide repeat protein [Tolypothrix sp. FACHB-123]
MRSCKMGLSVLVCLLAIFSASFGSSLLMVFTESRVLAQTVDARKAEADKLFKQGIQQYQTSLFEAALQSWQQALIIYREIKDRDFENATLGNIGLVYLDLGNYTKAIEYFQQVLAIAREIKDRDLESASLGNLGVAYLYLGDYPKAINYQQQRLAIAREIKDHQGEGKALVNLGIAYYNLGNYPKAIEYYQQSLAIARKIQDRPTEARVLGSLGNVYDSLGNYPKAIEYHQQSLAIVREIKDRQSEGRILGNLGLAYFSLRDYPKAIEYHQQSLAIAREIKDRQTEGNALSNLGVAYLSLGEYPKAIEYHQQSLAIAREIKDRQGEGKSLGNLGNAYSSLGNYPKAIEYYTQTLAIAQEIKDRQSEKSALGNIGVAYRSLGDYPKALEYQQQSLAIAQEIKDRQGESSSLGNIGSVYLSLGDYPKAIDYFQQQLVITREIKDPKGESNALGNIGNVYLDLGDYPKAIEYFQQVLVIAREIKDRQSEGQSLGNLGNAYSSLGNYSKAIEYQQQSLVIAREIKDRQGESHSLRELGSAYLYQGDYPKAIDYYKQNLALAQEIKDRLGEGASLNNLGIAFYKGGNLPAAEKTLYEGIKVKESLRGKKLADTNKVSLFDTQNNTYRILQQVLIAQNKTDAALEISERGRGRAFVELLASRLSANLQEEPPTPTNIREIKQIAKAQNSTLIQYSIIYDEFKINGKREIKESELYIWVIKPTGEVTFRKADLKPLWQKENINLEQLVKISRQSIGVRGAKIENPPQANPETQKKRLQKLHEILISPIADLLPKKETDKVVFIPQSSLFLVPFPALQDENGKYLIEKHTILTSPSIQVLDLTKKQYQKLGNQPLQTNNMLIVGNPIMPKVTIKIGETPQQLPPLDGAEKEAKAIANLFKIQPLLGKQATESTVVQRLPQAQIIHFATHGLFDDIRGLDSSIALTPENLNSLSSPLSKEEQKRDGLLTAEEIFGLELKANLVVLSACDTGRGRITGDGVIGLSRSFISAGVPSVIVSLWSVDDGSTAFLMTEFYQNLQQKMDKATALRKAMLDTKKKYSNPSQWAAFTLIGESQ